MKAKLTKENIFPVVTWIMVISVMFFITVTRANFTIENSWTTLIVLGVMAILITVAQSLGVNRFNKITKAISKVSKKIEKMSSEKHEPLWEQLRKEHVLFENRELDKMFDRYKHEMDRLYREHEENIQCDIVEYINEDNIGEIVHTNLLEQLPGIMTGLGILGTFIGLAMGLSDFNNDGVEQMLASITPLIDGIKVAFYTSIYGVILSLAFNVYFKWCQGKFNRNLDEFYDTFHKHVIPLPANDMANQILHYQQSQSLAMQQFAETISVQFAKSFEQYAAPTFERIGNTMSDLSQHMDHTLNTLSDQISTKQKESMGEIVEDFISQMNVSMGGTFEQLKITIDDLCEGQKKTAEDVNDLIEHVCKTINEIDRINEVSNSIVQNLDEYCTKLNSYQTDVNEAYNRVQQQEDMFAEVTKKQQLCLVSINEHEAVLASNISSLTDRIKEVSEIFKNHINMLNQYTEEQLHTFTDSYNTFVSDLDSTAQRHMEQNRQTLDQMVNSLNQSSQSLKGVADEFHSNLKGSIDRTFEQFDTNLSEIALCLSGTITEINDTTQNIPKVLRGSFVSMQKQLEEYIVTIDELRKVSQIALEKMTDNVDEQLSNEIVVVTENEA